MSELAKRLGEGAAEIERLTTELAEERWVNGELMVRRADDREKADARTAELEAEVERLTRLLDERHIRLPVRDGEPTSWTMSSPPAPSAPLADPERERLGQVAFETWCGHTKESRGGLYPRWELLSRETQEDWQTVAEAVAAAAGARAPAAIVIVDRVIHVFDDLGESLEFADGCNADARWFGSLTPGERLRIEWHPATPDERNAKP